MGNRPSYPGTPRWVKATGIVVFVLVLLVVIMFLTWYGPGRHTSSGDFSKTRSMTRYGWRKQYGQRRKRYTREPSPKYKEES